MGDYFIGKTCQEGDEFDNRVTQGEFGEFLKLVGKDPWDSLKIFNIPEYNCTFVYCDPNQEEGCGADFIGTILRERTSEMSARFAGSITGVDVPGAISKLEELSGIKFEEIKHD
ncbi:hypothetical protein HOA55_01260 [archaeon]|jgi:hypothetical protein|nr:hypothetical protein [archaeon]MBT3578065.1 hypothetical protein [archaeon]MBT6819962.1 hypothetical protein [archaeon]MBT6956309.1 hypothetical protein [archaeon]MBT7024999.1 hypothetical protein [archaeon]